MAAKAPRILTADELLSADDLGEALVEVPAWGGAVRVRGLSLGQFREAQRRSLVRGELDEEKLTLAIVQAGMVEPQLTDEQAEKLRDKSATAIATVAERITALSGFGEDAPSGAAFPD